MSFRSLSAFALAFALAVPMAAQVPAPVVAPELAKPDTETAEPSNGRSALRTDNFQSPKQAEQARLRNEALKQRLSGKGSGRVQQVAKGQYVDFQVQRNDRVFVLLVEYGDKAPVNAPEPAVQISQAAGPLHNQIPAPDRAKDNSTIWQANYDRAHYENMYFSKMVDYYRAQSSGRYTINGDVTEWVKVPFNGPRYGANSLTTFATWTLIADGINLWTNNQIASGKSLEEVKAYLQTFDVYDRYDFDADGNFDEKDGYIDHFQIVHSGAGEETGGGTLGADAIWSHRFAAFYNWATVAGPSFNPAGGVEFGGGWGANPTGAVNGSHQAYVADMYGYPSDSATSTVAHPKNQTGIFVLDYTIQPENGGLGVFAHEYGHDLGLPDHYDRQGGDNSTGYWTIMSSGSYLGDGTTDTGSTPGDFGAWDKIQLGWSNYELASAGVPSDHKLGPAETNTKKAQAVVVQLPAEKNTFLLYNPANGGLPSGKAWWSGRGNQIERSMTRSITFPTAPTAPATSIRMTMNAYYSIETNYDYAFVEVSLNNGATWLNVTAPITGSSNGNWVNLGWTLNSLAGRTVLLRVRYKTDQFEEWKGFAFDNLTIDGKLVDGAENGANGWTLNGFRETNGVEVSGYPHFYIAEYRQYRTYDKGLQTGPYWFSDLSRTDWVSHFPYQDGLLVTYYDTEWADNDTSVHRGEGMILPVDAHPEPLLRDIAGPAVPAPFTSPWTASVQAYDSTFGLEATDPLSLAFYGNIGGVLVQFPAQYHASLPAVSTFNDMNTYWYPRTSASGVIVPQTGTSIRVVNTSAQGNFMQIQVNQ